MHIITVAHQKGGVGKSTLVLNLACCLAQKRRVAVLDTDPQGSINNLAAFMQRFTLLAAHTPLADLRSKDFDFIIIDSPPYLTEHMLGLFAISDYVLIPTKAGFFDLVAIRDTIKLLESVMREKPALKAGIVLNMISPRRSGLMGEAKEALKNQYGLPIVPTVLHQRDSYVRSLTTNGVVAGTDEKANQEILYLTSDILTQLLQ